MSSRHAGHRLQGERPIASVRPMMSNMLRPPSQGVVGGGRGEGGGLGGGLTALQSRLLQQSSALKPGVSVQQIQTTQGREASLFSGSQLILILIYF